MENEDEKEDEKEEVVDGAKFLALCTSGAATLYFVIQATELIFSVKIELKETECKKEITLNINKKLDVTTGNKKINNGIINMNFGSITNKNKFIEVFVNNPKDGTSWNDV